MVNVLYKVSMLSRHCTFNHSELPPAKLKTQWSENACLKDIIEQKSKFQCQMKSSLHKRLDLLLVLLSLSFAEGNVEKEPTNYKNFDIFKLQPVSEPRLLNLNNLHYARFQFEKKKKKSTRSPASFRQYRLEIASLHLNKVVGESITPSTKKNRAFPVSCW